MILLKDDCTRIALFEAHLRSIIAEYHSLLDSQPKAEILEELLVKALHRSGIETDWNPDFNHKVGKDLTILSNNERISIKTGKIKTWKNRPNRNLSISGSRLTSHETLKEKIQFISDKKEDSYMLLAASEQSRNYQLIMFDTKLLDYRSANWHDSYNKEGNKRTGYQCETENFIASIKFSMSDQLWTEVKDYHSNPRVLTREICV